MLVYRPMRYLLRLVLAIGLLACAFTSTFAQANREEAQRTLDVLQDPAKRDQLIETLKTIVQAQPKPPEVTPNSLGAEVLVGASGFLDRLSGQVVTTIGAIQSIPLLWVWLKVMATDSWAHGVLLDSAWRLILVLTIGLVVQWVLGRTVNRPILAMVRRAPDGHAVEEADAEARAEQGEIEPPLRRRLAAITLLRRVPLVL